MEPTEEEKARKRESNTIYNQAWRARNIAAENGDVDAIVHKMTWDALQRELLQHDLTPPCTWGLLCKKQLIKWVIKLRNSEENDEEAMTNEDMTLDLPNLLDKLDDLKLLSCQELTNKIVEWNYDRCELVLELKSWGETGHCRCSKPELITHVVKYFWRKMHGKEAVLVTDDELQTSVPTTAAGAESPPPPAVAPEENDAVAPPSKDAAEVRQIAYALISNICIICLHYFYFCFLFDRMSVATTRHQWTHQ